MIRIFPDFSVQVTAAAGGVAGGGMATGTAVGRVPIPGTTANGNPQNIQGIAAYQQRYAGVRLGQLFFTFLSFYYI